jgi:hypothetical protein
MSSIDQLTPNSEPVIGSTSQKLAYLKIAGRWMPIQVINSTPGEITYTLILGEDGALQTAQVETDNPDQFYLLDSNPHFPAETREE